MADIEIWSEPFSGAQTDIPDELPGEPEPAIELQPQRETHRQALTWQDLLNEVKGKRWERFVPTRRMPPNPDRIVNKQVTDDEEHANLAPTREGTDTVPEPPYERLPDGRDLQGQREAIVTVHTRDASPERLFFVRTVTGVSATQILGRDVARRSALIVNEDAANSVSLATRLEHCTASGTLTFTLGPGKSLSTSSISEVWAIAVAGTPAVSVATEAG